MNDIKLTGGYDGCYDWSFKHNDVENVIGDQQIISSVIHSVLLNYGELEQYAYIGKGSNTRQYVYLRNVEENKALVKAELEAVCNACAGVQSSEVTLSQSDTSIVVEKIIITKNNGGVLEIAI